MFDLSSDDLRLRILGCADGPASFNAEATAAGFSVTSCDPLYRFGAADIARRIADTTEVIIEQTRRNQEEFIWNLIRSVDELRTLRVSAMERFIADFSHFLFLYSERLSEDFHVTAIFDMTRVAREVRIFPLLALGAARSPHVDGVSQRLRDGSLVVTIESVPYEFQRGGNQMMRVRSVR